MAIGRKKQKAQTSRPNSIHGLVFVPFAFSSGAYGATSTRATKLTYGREREILLNSYLFSC